MRWLAVLLLLCGATPAAATVDAWPALHDVVGVAADDVLNIRAEPSAASAIIGTLPYNAEGIEVIRPSEDFDWGLINADEGTGWVSLRYTAPQPGQWDGRLPRIRQCVGTEPFWSMEFDGAEMTLSTPETTGARGLIAARHSATSRRDRFALRGHMLPGEFGALETTIFLRVEACSDGMSDRAFGIATDILITDPDASDGLAGTVFVSGCCSLAGR